jgi:hypothetical protein
VSGQNDKPAGILSAERLVRIRQQAALWEDEIRWPDELREAVPALLAHIDALTPSPGEVDAEALGCRLHRFLHSGDAAVADREWRLLFDDQRERWTEQAVAIHAIGYAAGRSEGEAERARLIAQWEEERGLRCDDANKASDRSMAQCEEIARLTAELAAERARIDRIHGEHRAEIGRWIKAADAARAEGAREERERWQTICASLASEPEHERTAMIIVGRAEIDAAKRARGAR